MEQQRPSVKSVFDSALEITAPARREEYLDRVCAGAPDLRQEVQALLRAYEEAGSFLEPPDAPPLPPARPSAAMGEWVGRLVQPHPAEGSPQGPPTAAGSLPGLEPVREGPGAALGPYKLLEQIGEGGFGVVFLAEQQQPLRRRVALKVLKPGMDTRQVIARFEAERQALALMDHPHIARVLDGGETASGRPYFVMELVRGIPITEFCDQGRLTTGERLQLFVDVCQAVQHAHHKGIIHRDLKPSNVLVTVQDGAPSVKVIDFGIAKAVGQQLTDKTVFTGFAQLVGTPLYMSPEQAGLSGLDVDTRSDIYSLGVLLYELLSGTTPFDKERLRTVGYDELRRIIREEEPPRPSTRLSTLGQAATTIALQRQSDPRRLSQLFRGELDWIVMKALEKDRNRRYESASAFAEDVQRYLEDKPVHACPPSAAYRLRKFVRRNKSGLAIAGLILFFLVLLGGSAGWIVHDRAARQDQLAKEVTPALVEAQTLLAEADKEADNPERLQATVRLAEKAVARAEGLLAAGGSTEELAQQVQEVRAAVDAAAVDGRVSAQLGRIEVRLSRTLDKSSRRREEARLQSRYAAVLRDYGVDPAVPEAAAARVRGSRVRQALLAALGEWRRCMTTGVTERRRLEQVLDLAQPAPDAFGAKWRAAWWRRDGATLKQLAHDPAVKGLLATEFLQLGDALGGANEWAAAAELLREGCRCHPDSFRLNFKLACLLHDLYPKQTHKAIAYYQAALAVRGPDPFLYYHLALALYEQRDGDEAIRHYQAALEMDPDFVWAHNGLGVVLWHEGDRAAARREFETALRLDPDYIPAHLNLGYLCYFKEKGDPDAAIREYETALRIDPDCEAAHNNFGLALHQKNDLDGAIQHYQAAIRINPEYADAHYNLGNARKAKGDLQGAIPSYRRAVQINPQDADVRTNLGNTLRNLGDREGALREYVAALKSNPNHAKAYYNLGIVLHQQGDLESAVRAFRNAIQRDPAYSLAHLQLGFALADKRDGDGAIAAFKAALKIDPNDAELHNALGHALLDKGNAEGAIREFQRALQLNPDHAEAHCHLGLIYLQQGRFAEALRALKTGHQLGVRNKGWPHPSTAWVRQASIYVELESKLPKVLSEEVQPRDAAETVILAKLCQEHKKLYAAAARLYRAAFARDAKLADDLDAAHRYNAACAAALAAAGQGNDAATLDDHERARLRRQALDWLRTDLSYYTKLADGPAAVRSLVQSTMAHWQRDQDFAGVRGPALVELPEAERLAWTQLWAEVGKTLHKAQGRSSAKEQK